MRPNEPSAAVPITTPDFPVDMVFTYVDGADPAFAERRRAALQGGPGPGGSPPAVSREHERRYRGVDEITYSVRSVLTYLPWVRSIHIVTDTQVPPVDSDLLASGRVRIVDHAEIIPAEYRPVFASTIIESCLHRIPGLSDVFLYNNDDYMHFSPVPRDMFLTAEPGGHVALTLRASRAFVRSFIRAVSAPLPACLPRANTYTAGVANATAELRRRLRLSWLDVIVPRHVTQVYRRSTAARIEEVFADVLHRNRALRFRTHQQVSYGTMAYTLERHWHPEDRTLLWGPREPRSDVRVFDFLHCTTPESCAPVWDDIAASDTRLVCLNNVPHFERERFHLVMREKGLGEQAGTDGR